MAQSDIGPIQCCISNVRTKKIAVNGESGESEGDVGVDWDWPRRRIARGLNFEELDSCWNIIVMHYPKKCCWANLTMILITMNFGIKSDVLC